MKKLFVLALSCAVLFTSCKCRQNKNAEGCTGNCETCTECCESEQCAACADAVLRLNVPVKAAPEAVENIIALGTQLVAASLNDEGALEYDMFKSETKEGTLLIYETWKCQACLDKHSAAEHFTTLVPQIQAAAQEMTIEQFVKEEEPQTEGKTIRINCHVACKDAANKEAVLALVKQLVEASQSDEGVIDYDVYSSVTRPEQLLIFETWKCQACLDKHSASSHFTTIVPMVQDLAESMSIEIFTK